MTIDTSDLSGKTGCYDRRWEPKVHRADVRSAKGESKGMNDDIPKKTMTAMIDETGDQGGRTHGDNYVIGATVIPSENVEKFRAITEKRHENKELKFREMHRSRNDILDEISELDPDVYAVIVEKEQKKWTKGEQRNVHKNSLRTIVDKIVGRADVGKVDFIIDENNKAKEGTVKDIVDDVSSSHDKEVTCDIRKSEKDFTLQTNDFVVGSLGKRYNRSDNQYIERLGVNVHEIKIEPSGVKKPRKK